VLHPYQLVKDHRRRSRWATSIASSGDIDVFIKTYLMKKASGTLGQAAPDDDLD
jgi:peptide chain release factor 2